MQIWKWLILSVMFTVTSSYCSGLILQHKNQSEPLSSEALLADVTENQRGHLENSTKAQGVLKRTRGLPGFRTSLDPFSRSFMKKDKKRHSKKPQKRLGQNVDQITPKESSAFTILKPEDITPADKVQLGESNPMQQPKSNGPTDILTSEKNPTDHVRKRVSKNREKSGAFGLPIDRIGLGHLPHGRG